MLQFRLHHFSCFGCCADHRKVTPALINNASASRLRLDILTDMMRERSPRLVTTEPVTEELMLGVVSTRALPIYRLRGFIEWLSEGPKSIPSASANTVASSTRGPAREVTSCWIKSERGRVYLLQAWHTSAKTAHDVLRCLVGHRIHIQKVRVVDVSEDQSIHRGLVRKLVWSVGSSAASLGMVIAPATNITSGHILSAAAMGHIKEKDIVNVRGVITEDFAADEESTGRVQQREISLTVHDYSCKLTCRKQHALAAETPFVMVLRCCWYCCAALLPLLEPLTCSLATCDCFCSKDFRSSCWAAICTRS